MVNYLNLTIYFLSFGYIFTARAKRSGSISLLWYNLIVLSPMKSTLNPILHGRGFTEPPLVDDLSWFLGGCSKWAQISWVCFSHHLPRPIEAIFQKKILKFWKTEKKIFNHSNIKGSPLWKKNFKIKFFHFFSNKSYFFYLNLNFICS